MKRIQIVFAVLVLAAAATAQEPPEAPAAPAPPASPRAPRPPRASRSATVVAIPYGRSYLGVDITDVTSDRLGPLKLKEERGVEIINVDQDAPAGKAGLKEHDVILEFNGTKVESEEQFRRLLRESHPGRAVTLGISRDGQPMNIQVTLGDRRKVMSGNQGWNFEMPAIPPMPEIHVPEITIPGNDFVIRSYTTSSGILVESLTPQLGDFFGVKNGEGVLVRSVEKGSAAEAAGLRAGDVIVKFEGRKISDQSDWRHALRTRKTGKVSLGIIREKRELAVTLSLPEPRQRGDSSRLVLPLDEIEGSIREEVLAWNRSRPEIERALAELKAQNMDQVRRGMSEYRQEIEKALREVRESLRGLNDD